jgi:deoxyribose-phosphate aldolase
MISYLDVTYLEEETNQAKLAALCDAIATVHPAGICVYARDLNYVIRHLQHRKLAFVTVINFPKGNQSSSQVKAEIETALSLGATELDVVIPYQQFLKNQQPDEIGQFIQMCKDAIPGYVKLKCILETGELATSQDIYQLSTMACLHGADFIKTSTGKVNQGATLEATQSILQAIANYDKKTKRKVGIKVAGGVRTQAQAQSFINQVCNSLGETWLVPSLFRIGASQLFHILCNQTL